MVDATQELDKRTKVKKVKAPDPTLEFVKAWWGFWLPGLVNQSAKQPSEVFPFTNPFWWLGWKK